MIILYIAVKIILAVLFILFVLLLAVFVIPFNYAANGQKFENITASGRISWLFGGIRVAFDYNSENGLYMNLMLLGFKKRIENKKPTDKPVSAKKKRPEKKAQKPAYSYLTYAVIQKMLESVMKILNHCKPKRFHLHMRVGFEDPLYNGLFYGIKYSGYAILNKFSIELQPTFEEEALEGDFEIEGGIQILYFILVGIGFVFTRPFRSIVVKNITFKMKRRLKRWRVILISTKA